MPYTVFECFLCLRFFWCVFFALQAIVARMFTGAACKYFCLSLQNKVASLSCCHSDFPLIAVNGVANSAGDWQELFVIATPLLTTDC